MKPRKDNAMPPSWKSDKFLVKDVKKTGRELHHWRLANEPGYAEMVGEMRRRHDLIMKAKRAGLLGWVDDPDHYRPKDRGPATYCECGTVEEHNARHDAILEQMDDGR